MKKVLLTLIICLFATSALAGIQGQGQIGINKQGQAQGQIGINKQGQKQGQGQIQGNLGIQKGNTTSVTGDDYEAYAFTAPSLSANKGVSELNAYSIMGGIGVSNTEEWQVAFEKIVLIQNLEAMKYLDHDSAQLEALETYEQIKESTRPKRVLGFLWKTRGRHLGNLMGLIAMDDIRFKIKRNKNEDINDGSGNNGNL